MESMTENTAAVTTPQQAWERFREGNERFVRNDVARPHMDVARRDSLQEGQAPDAVVLACSDSRVPVELIFDAGFGDVFVVRTAGEILGESVIGSISFAVNSLDVPLVIVLGHESCGAVQATIDALDGGQIPGDHQRVLVERVAPSILMARSDGETETAALERRHAGETARQLVSRMPQLQAKIEAGAVGVVAGRYLLGTGAVEIVTSFGVDTPASNVSDEATRVLG